MPGSILGPHLANELLGAWGLLILFALLVAIYAIRSRSKERRD